MSDMETNRTHGEGIVRAGMLVFIAHLVFKLIGFVQFFVVGGLTETVQWECVYGFAFEGVIFTLFLVGEEIIGPAFLPVFIDEKERKSETDAWKVANTLLLCQFIILTAVVGILFAFPAELTSMVTYFEPHGSGNFELASSAVRALAPALICLSLGSTTYMLLNGYKKFFLAAFGDSVWKAFILVSVVGGAYFFGIGWKALAFGIVFGSLLKIVTHLAGLLPKLRFFRVNASFRNKAFKTMLTLMLPLLIGVIFAKCRDFYNNITVLSSLEADGLIKANSYGRKLFQAVGMIVPYALSIAMFPFFCDLVSKDNKEQLGQILTRSGRMLLSIFVPVAIFCTVFSPELVKMLVMGQFSAEDARLAGISMACYTLVLPAYGLEMFLMQAFFAKRKMYSVIVIGMIFSGLSVAVSYVGVIVYHAGGATALVVVALGYVVSRYLKTASLLILLKRTVPLFEGLENGLFILKLCITGALTAAAAWAAFFLLDQAGMQTISKAALAIRLAIAACAGTAAFLASTRLLHVAEPREMTLWTIRKLTKRSGS